jgi:hypothetical protein
LEGLETGGGFETAGPRIGNQRLPFLTKCISLEMTIKEEDLYWCE